ncbi:MAG: acyl-CoA dehydrogenase family protein [Actinomycetes bacterium]|jgi:alkylation response protein AidB-like acyl-CoA dehydrogenase|nr:acyl-CoA dehydrogenase family protein [Actinomycetes bacterium]
MSPVERQMPTADGAAAIELARELVDKELAPKVTAHEESGRFPRDVFHILGRAGLLGLPYPEEYGGAAQPYEVYTQVVEELARGWLAVGLGVSVHTLSCYPLATVGTEEQKREWLSDLVGGELLGAYCLSEPQSGSDAAALSTRAVPDGADYRVNGTKAWISHAGQADFYSMFVRTSDDGSRGISCLLTPADTPGLTVAPAERKMGLKASTTAQIVLDNARIPVARRLGAEGDGFGIALGALDGGRLGIAACAVGLAQAALELAVGHAKERRQFGQTIIDFQGLQFMLADMATQVAAGRALYIAAARRRDAGLPSTAQAAMAKLFCTDMAMKVTTDTVQVLGGYGYVSDFPAERYMREAKVLQIVEGTNQVQRIVIGRHLQREPTR